MQEEKDTIITKQKYQSLLTMEVNVGPFCNNTVDCESRNVPS